MINGIKIFSHCCPKKLLIFYFNEHCLPDSDAQGANNLISYSGAAKNLVAAIKQCLLQRDDIRLFLDRVNLHAHLANKPLISWLEEWLSKDEFRLLKSHIIFPGGANYTQTIDLSIEVKFSNKYADGMTLATIRESWVWGLSLPNEICSESEIPAEKYSLDIGSQELLKEMITVKNLSSSSHYTKWSQEVNAWGYIVSADNVLCQFDSLLIVMYPLDHGYPHIHVLSSSTNTQLGKYAVDKFSVLEGKDSTINSTIKSWVGRHLQSLLVSWDRCQKGLHPLKIVE